MIRLVNVSKFYSSNNVIALGLRKVNLELHRNEFVAIVGESGSGKTTLLNVISGIDSYEDGEMYINDKETSYFSIEDMENYRKKYVAFVFQNYNLIDSYTVLQNVEAPLILSGYPKEKIRERAKEIIRKVGLEDHMNHKSTKLSGGQKQRVVIARALAKDCPIIAADEPTGNLDSKSAKQIIQLLHDISKDKLVIMVTHDFNQVKDYATRKIRIFDGEIVEDYDLEKVDKTNMPDIPDEEHQIKFVDYLKISLRNMTAVPKKTLLMFLVFTFFSFFIALSYGAYQLSMQEINYSHNYHFNNTNPNRIIINKRDNTPFTTEELEELVDNNIVADIVPFDYVLDEDLYLYSAANEDMDFFGLFLPVNLIDASDLTYGRMPIAANEIVLAINDRVIENSYEDILNQTFKSYNYWYDRADQVEYEVVGLLDVSELIVSSEGSYDIYYMMTDEALEDLSVSYYFNYVDIAQIEFEDTSVTGKRSIGIGNMDIQIDNTLADKEIKIASAYYGKECETPVCYEEGSLRIEDNYVDFLEDEFTLSFYKSMVSEPNVIYVNQDTYGMIFYDDIYQVSILTDTEVGVSSFVRSLQRETDGLGLKYKVAYPYDSEAGFGFEALLLLMMNIGFIVLIFVTMVGSTFITYIIFRAIINTKLHDYAIFRTIGANKNVIKSFIYLENLFIVIMAYVTLVAVSLALPLDLVENTMLQPLKMYDFFGYIIFLVLLIMMSLVISRRYCNRIFKETVQRTLKTDLG